MGISAIFSVSLVPATVFFAMALVEVAVVIAVLESISVVSGTMAPGSGYCGEL